MEEYSNPAHRGHSRAFLLKFDRDRDVYPAEVREQMQQPQSVFRRKKMLPAADEVWLLQETVIPYGQKALVKNAAKALM